MGEIYTSLGPVWNGGFSENFVGNSYVSFEIPTEFLCFRWGVQSIYIVVHNTTFNHTYNLFIQ